MILYNLKSEISHANVISYRITKFDEDLNPESSYIVHNEVCECPAGVRPTCRHRVMLPIMLPHVDTEWFYNYDNATWYDAIGNEVDFELIGATAPADEASFPRYRERNKEAIAFAEPRRIRRLR